MTQPARGWTDTHAHTPHTHTQPSQKTRMGGGFFVFSKSSFYGVINFLLFIFVSSTVTYTEVNICDQHLS